MKQNLFNQKSDEWMTAQFPETIFTCKSPFKPRKAPFPPWPLFVELI
jgi:hypothetical protein